MQVVAAGLGRSVRRRNRVGLVGFYGRGNYGDELFADTYVEHLGDLADLRVLADLPQPPHFSRPAKSVVASTDAVLIGGGDLLTPWHYSQCYWHPALLDRPVLVAGVGVPALRAKRPDPAALERYAAFLSHPSVRFIQMRDTYSADWVNRHVVPAVPVRVRADVVCSLPLPPVEPVAGPPILGVVTRARPGHVDDYQHVQTMALAAQSRGMRVRHIVLGLGALGARDLADAARLEVPGKELVVATDLDDLSRAIGQCRLLVSMKFHGTVVATMYGVPSLCIMPTAKNRRFLTAIGRPELVASLRDPTLPDRLAPLPDPIASEASAALRQDALAGMKELRAALLDVIE